MSQQVLHKRSNETVNGMAKAPAASGLSYGEIAINYNAGTEKIFIKNSNNEVVSFGADKNNPFEPGTGANSAQQKGGSNTASGDHSHAEGKSTTASGTCSHAEGRETTALGYSSHAEGRETTAQQDCSHAEGEDTTASGYSSHAEGLNTTAGGGISHAEGWGTEASGEESHAEGEMTAARGDASHTEGGSTVASDYGCHAEGYSTVASGYTSHAEGQVTLAKGLASHAEGERTTAENESEHAEGRNNVSNKASETYGNSGNTQHSVGIGTSPSDKKNAFEIMQNGDAYMYGVGGYDGTNATASTASTLQQILSGKQDTLVSGTNIKTVNGSSVLGSGNIDTTQNIFIAQAYVTDYQTISDAIQSGKCVLLRHTLVNTGGDDGYIPNPTGDILFQFERRVDSSTLRFFTYSILLHEDDSDYSSYRSMYKVYIDVMNDYEGTTWDMQALRKVIDDATSTHNGLMPATDKQKLDDIEEATQAEIDALFDEGGGGGGSF